ncbi:polymer-forming cytoskeletal protein [Flavobacterium sp. HSC-61S13]|uniref:bactofilin family protein n=1 Tax=Flavobacterium sp. HSC-61S13 TaxID=2910963 RepID=UPI00209DC6CC|nr:polymer-forming cytoskeletal protein [Flavobacterium sp. HSC-61S13]MCP1995077.1 cytoskeletal protein CcmA (bactofilin family) [Flavobacterium sp. HSC-61S13]
MFDKPKKKIYTDLLGKTNRIVEGTTITGSIETIADFRLDGILLGNFTSQGRLVLGPRAEIRGDVVCENADIEGVVEGKMNVSKLLILKSSAVVSGEVTVGHLSVELGATFTASCKMTGIKPLDEKVKDK